MGEGPRGSIITWQWDRDSINCWEKLTGIDTRVYFVYDSIYIKF